MADMNRQSGSSRTQLQQSPQRRSSGLARRGIDPFFSSPREFFTANPFSMMRRMTEEMGRMLDEFGGMQSETEQSIWSPAIEVAERDGKYVIHAELPGLKPEDVKVELLDDSLIIQGERKFEHQENQGGVQRSERRYGQFYRAIPLPEGVSPEQVNARFENGMLEVTAPIANRSANRRQIPIQGSAGSSSNAPPASAGKERSGSERAA